MNYRPTFLSDLHFWLVGSLETFILTIITEFWQKVTPSSFVFEPCFSLGMSKCEV